MRSNVGRLFPFIRQEYLRIMRGRLAKLLWGMMAYAVVVVPILMKKPPPEIVEAVESWLGESAGPSKLVLFVWVDASMNKFALMMGPVLAGGIIVDERARGALDLYASKPINASDYFTAKLVAACAAMTSFYVGGTAGALLTFPWRIEAFDPGAFPRPEFRPSLRGALRGDVRRDGRGGHGEEGRWDAPEHHPPERPGRPGLSGGSITRPIGRRACSTHSSTGSS